MESSMAREIAGKMVTVADGVILLDGGKGTQAKVVSAIPGAHPKSVAAIVRMYIARAIDKGIEQHKYEQQISETIRIQSE